MINSSIRLQLRGCSSEHSNDKQRETSTEANGNESVERQLLNSYEPSFPKYSSTNAFFRKSSNTFSISSEVGIFGGINISGVKNGIYAAAARACAAVGESSFASKPAAGWAEPSFFGRFRASSGVDDASPLAISVSSSGGCFRFGCVVSSALPGVDGSVTGSAPRPC